MNDTKYKKSGETVMSIENNTLQEWLKKNAGNQCSDVIAKLVQRGYSEVDLNMTIQEHIKSSPFLLLNSLYETMIALKINDTKEKLKPIESLTTEYESKTPDAVAHFIWVGKPRDDYKDTLGIRTLIQNKPRQEIRFWVLNEYANSYRKTFEKQLNIKIISIENYAKKINITFDTAGKVSLYSQIDHYVKRAKKMLTPNITAVAQKLVIRDRVTVVDYIKTTIPLYEGGFVFDADTIFLKSSTANLSKNKKWLFPIEAEMASGSDVWFYYCNREMNWDFDKNHGKAFWTTPTSLQPKWQTHLLGYHEVISLLEKAYRNKLETIAITGGARSDAADLNSAMGLYGTAILLLCHTKEVTDSTDAIKRYLSTQITPNCKIALDWYSQNHAQFRHNIEFKNATLLTKARYKRIVGSDAYYVNLDSLRFIKRLNRSHNIQTIHTPSITLCHASMPDFAIQQEMIGALKPFCGNELLQITDFVTCTNGTTLCEAPVQNVTPLHMAILFNAENFPNLLTLITPDQLYNLCTNKINIDGQLVQDFFGGKVAPTTLTELISYRHQSVFSEEKEDVENCLKALMSILKSTSKQFSKLSLKSAPLFTLERALDFSGCSFEGADLGDANFSSTKLDKAKLNNVIINHTKFEGASYSQIECDRFTFILPTTLPIVSVEVDTTDFLTRFEKAKNKTATVTPGSRQTKSNPSPSLLFLQAVKKTDGEVKKTNGEKLLDIFSNPLNDMLINTVIRSIHNEKQTLLRSDEAKKRL